MPGNNFARNESVIVLKEYWFTWSNLDALQASRETEQNASLQRYCEILVLCFQEIVVHPSLLWYSEILGFF